MSIKVASLIVAGFARKLTDVTEVLKINNLDVLVIQETHLFDINVDRCGLHKKRLFSFDK